MHGMPHGTRRAGGVLPAVLCIAMTAVYGVVLGALSAPVARGQLAAALEVASVRAVLPPALALAARTATPVAHAAAVAPAVRSTRGRPPPLRPPPPPPPTARRCTADEAAAERAATERLWGGPDFSRDTTGKADIDRGGGSYIASLRAAGAAGGLPQAPLVLNVGANRGEFALAVLATLPDATVVSFEPFPATFALLAAARAAAPRAVADRWVLHNVGCGDANDPAVKMWGAPGDEGAHAGAARGEEHLGAHAAAWGGETARFVRVGDWMDAAWRNGSLPAPAVDLLQVDAEGFDGPVLAGFGWRAHARRVAMVAFETGGAWLWASHNPKGYRLGDALLEAQSAGFECFLAGQRDLWRVTPWFAPPGSRVAADLHSPARMQVGTNVLCVRADTPYFAALLAAHSVSVRHAVCAGPAA